MVRPRIPDSTPVDASSRTELDEFLFVPGRNRYTLDNVIRKRKRSQRNEYVRSESRKKRKRDTSKSPSPTIKDSATAGNPTGESSKRVSFAAPINTLVQDTQSAPSMEQSLDSTVMESPDTPSDQFIRDLDKENKVDVMTNSKEVSNELDPTSYS